MRNLTVSDLATLAGKTADETLLTLWYSGLFEVEDNPHFELTPNQVERALVALNLAKQEINPDKKISWWLTFLGISREEFAAILIELDCDPATKSRNLPKGAYRKLERKYKDKLAPSYQIDQVETSETPELDDEFHPIPAPEMEIIGTPTDVKHLTFEEVNAIHDLLEREFADSNDPISPPGIKDSTMLDSAIYRPLLAKSKYPSVEMASAALMHSLIKNHAFYNGNKRTGVVSLLVMLDKNGLRLNSSDAELFSFAVKVAASELLEHPRHYYSQVSDHETFEMARWIKRHAKPLPPDSKVRNLKWAELKGILITFDCHVELENGNATVTRLDPTRNTGFFSLRPKTLKATVRSPNARTEIDKGEIQDLRKRLKLDSSFVSNGEFYSPGKYTSSNFIQVYSTVLNRLAKI